VSSVARENNLTEIVERKPWLPWMVTIAAAFFLLVGSLSLNMLTPIMSIMLDDFQATTNFGSAMYFMDTFVSAILVIPIGLAINKWGYRKLGYLGYIVLLIAFAWGATAFSANQTSILIIRSLQGVGYVVPPILSIAVVSQWFPEKKRGIPLSIVASMTFIAKSLALQMSKITIPLDSWHGQFAGCFVLTCIGFVLYIIFLKAVPGLNIVGKREKTERAPITEVLKDFKIWLIIIIMVAYTLGQRGFSPFSNLIWVQNCGVSNNRASDIDSIFFLMAIPSGLFFGFILSHFLKKRGKITAIMLTVFFLGMPLAFLLSQTWQAWLFVFIVGMMGGVPQFCQICLPMFSRTPAVVSMALVAYDLIGKYITASIAPFVVSSIQTATGTWIYSAIPIAIAGVVAVIACWILGVRVDKESRIVKENKNK